MAWTRIDDKFFDNPKVRTAGKEATYLYISALVYASNQMTEGYISDEVLGLVAYKGFIKNEIAHAKTLIDCELWDRVQGGYQIHDFLEYNPTRAEIEQARAKKQFAGSKGAQVRWQTDSKSDGKPIASAIATASNFDSKPIAERWQSHSINPPPINPTPKKEIVDSSSSSFESPFIDVYVKATGIEPKKTEEEKELIQRFVKLGVQPIEYQKAIQEMQAKGYKIANMLSAETWTMNNRNGKKAHKPEPGSYEAWQVKLQADKMSINQKGA